MPDFSFKMYPIQFWLGLCPRPHWGLTVLPIPTPQLDLWKERGEEGEIFFAPFFFSYMCP